MDYDIPDWLRNDTRRRNAIKQSERNTKLIKRAVVGVIAIATLLALFQPYTVTYHAEPKQQQLPDVCDLEVVECEHERVEIEVRTAYAHVTGYNTVPEQTDSTPCIAASGANICGRTDVVACPRAIPLGTKVEIDGMQYVCEDRLAPKYDHRYDISCDKDMACPAQVTGYKKVTLLK